MAEIRTLLTRADARAGATGTVEDGGLSAFVGEPDAELKDDVTRRMRRERVLARRKRRARVRRNRVIAALVIALVASLSVAFASGGTPFVRVRQTPEHVRLATTLEQKTIVVPGTLGSFSWPSPGQGAVAVLGRGLMASSANEVEKPIASLTKMMTALVILHDHPLSLGQEGPSFTMNAADVAGWVYASQHGDSNVSVQKGEVLSEQQLLEALLIPSADNIANLLATWDAGSIPAFVVKMNKMARTLGLRNTTYADASGVDPSSRSTAADQAVIASTLMRNPVVRSIVSQSHLVYPVMGTIWNYNPALGVDGIVGVKSGYTSEAGGCLATAAYRTVDGQSVLVVAVALGQPDGLYGAARVDEGLLGDATTDLRAYRPDLPAGAVGTATVGTTVTPLSLSAPLPTVVAWPGLHLQASVVAAPTAISSSTSTTSPSTTPVIAANLVVSAPLGVLETVPLVTSSSVALGASGTTASDS